MTYSGEYAVVVLVCTCTPNDVCYSCYVQRRYGDEGAARTLPVGHLDALFEEPCVTCDGMIAGQCRDCGRVVNP